MSVTQPTFVDRLTSIFRSFVGSPPSADPPAEAPPVAPAPQDPALQALLDFASRTETGQNLVVQGRTAGFAISLVDAGKIDGKPGYSSPPFSNIIQINRNLPEDEQLLALVGELARNLLAKEGLAPTSKHTTLANIQMSRIVNGHMAATRAQVADEFARIGEPGPREKFASERPLVMAAYDRSKAAHAEAGTNGAAMAAAFIATYADGKQLAADESRQMDEFETRHLSSISNEQYYHIHYTGQQIRERKVAEDLLSIFEHPRDFYKASLEARTRKQTNPDRKSLLPHGNTDLMKLTNAHGVSYVSTFFPDFMPTDAEHASVLPKTAERIKALDEKRALGFRQFSKPNSIPVRDYLAAGEQPAPSVATTPEMRGPA